MIYLGLLMLLGFFLHFLGVFYLFHSRERLYGQQDLLTNQLITANSQLLALTAKISCLEVKSHKDALDAIRYNDYCKELSVIVENCQTTISAQNATIQKLTQELRQEEIKDFN